MKKIISILFALATVLSLAACSVDSGKTTAELVSEAEVERSKLVEESIQAEVERSEEMIESVDKIGKTKKNKQIVIRRPYANGEHYQVYIMNRKGICQHVIDYYYYDTVEMFERNNEKQKAEVRQKKIDSDPTTRMVAFKSDYDLEERNTYDQMYEFFSEEIRLGSNISIIE